MDVPLAAKYHRVQGLAAFLRRDTNAAAAHFDSARALEPDFVLPTTMVPTGHPVRALYEAAPTQGSSETLQAPAEGRLVLDGRAVLARSPDRPVIAQLVDPRGEVQWTALVQPGQPLPAYPTNGDGKPSSRQSPEATAPFTLHAVVGAGIAKGSVDRQYQAWGQLDESGSLLQSTTWDGWVSGQGPLFVLGGYARFGGLLDLGAEVEVFGIQRTVVAGYEAPIEGQDYEDTSSFTFDPQPHVWVVAEPRMRMLIQQQAAGAAYFLIGLPIGWSPGFGVDSDLPYPRAASRTTLGISFGGGVLWQLNEDLGFYAELPYQFDLLGRQAKESFGSEITYAPSEPSDGSMLYKPAFGVVIRL